MLPPVDPAPPAWQAELRHIFISAGHDYWGRQGEGRMQHGMSSPSEIECVADMGLRGDRYFGVRPGYKGQVTFFDLAVVEEVRRLFKLPRLPASVFRRNLIVSGARLADWKNRRFRFKGVEFEGKPRARARCSSRPRDGLPPASSAPSRAPLDQR